MISFGQKLWIEMEKNTNSDLGMLYEDSKNQRTGQSVSDQTFFFKKKTK